MSLTLEDHPSLLSLACRPGLICGSDRKVSLVGLFSPTTPMPVWPHPLSALLTLQFQEAQGHRQEQEPCQRNTSRNQVSLTHHRRNRVNGLWTCVCFIPLFVSQVAAAAPSYWVDVSGITNGIYVSCTMVIINFNFQVIFRPHFTNLVSDCFSPCLFILQPELCRCVPHFPRCALVCGATLQPR